jgi:hypothetical protein
MVTMGMGYPGEEKEAKEGPCKDEQERNGGFDLCYQHSIII